MTEGNHLNSGEYANNSERSKTRRFVENTKRAIRKVLTASGIAASTMGPMATTTTSSVVPASVNTITAMAPMATTAVKTISLGTAASLLAACGGDEPDDPIDVKDTVAPTINVSKSEVDITGGKQIRIEGNQLFIGDILVASRNDNVSKICKVSLSMNGKAITSGSTISEEGTLTIKVTDDAGNEKSSNIKLNVAKNAPSITVNKSDVNIFGGASVNISDNQLLIGDEVIASRKCDGSEIKGVSLSFNGQEIKSGDILNDEGKLVITVISDAGKTATTEINITNNAIYGLENLRQATIKVDEEIDLLEGITFADGVELVKVEVEIDGEKVEVGDPHHYVPEYPGTCSVIFTVKGKNGNAAEINVDNLTIKPLDYKEATLNTANMIQEKYPRYNNLQQSTKDFIYPHLITSYAACNRYKQDNRAHIIMGETADTDDIENIGQFEDPTDHAYEGYYRIRALSPDTPIKGCNDFWNNLENYVNQHPNDFFVISCAAGGLGGSSREDLQNNSETSPQKRILEKENVIIVCSGGNRAQAGWKMYNESIKNGNRYNASSTNSKLNNKITVKGYNSRGKDNYFSPRYSVYGGLRSAMPVGFDKDKGNIVMPMVPLISSNNREDQITDSSFPTAVTSGVIGNAISVIMANHPGITPEDAMSIIVDKYLIQEKFQYKDETTNRELRDGDYRYFIDIKNLIKNELLQSDKIENLQFNSSEVELPSSPGICYIGKGIQFEFGGKRYNTINTNQSILNQALKSGNLKRYWDKGMFKKYGGTNSANFSVYVVDKDGAKLPDTQLDITKDLN